MKGDRKLLASFRIDFISHVYRSFADSRLTSLVVSCVHGGQLSSL